MQLRGNGKKLGAKPTCKGCSNRVIQCDVARILANGHAIMSFAHGERHLAISSAIMMGKRHDNLFGHIFIYRCEENEHTFQSDEDEDA
jgi:hypothetical protein